MSAKGYYVYFDDENIPYFVEAVTNEASYDYPTDGAVYDPNTRELWVPPETKPAPAPDAGEKPAEEPPVEKEEIKPENPENPTEEKKPEEEVKIPGDEPGSGDISVSDNLVLEVPSNVANFKAVRHAQTQVPERKIAKPVIAEDEDVTKLMDEGLAQKIHQFQIQDFARQYFREHRTNHVFSRKRIAIEALVSFTSEPLTEPLLEALDKNCSKLALQCFKWILQYTTVIQSRAPAAAAENIVNMLMTNPALRDEVFFQLIKQTSHTPTNKILQKGLELFLIIATIFPSSRNSENWIKAHLVTMSRHPDILIAALAQFTYIRFYARCAMGRPLEHLEIGYVKKIPTQVSMGWQTFGSSIYEMMWNQRLKEPKLPIPFIEYYMADFLLKRGAAHTEGIFRLPGNLKKVDDMAIGTNDGKDMISGAALNDIASLFKKWFRELPNPVVPIDRVNDIVNLFDDGAKEYIPFVNTLPRPHKMVLMFLIGFLQELVKTENETKMTAKNFAIVFGPNIIQSFDINEQSMVKKFSDVSIDFMTTLIETWDTSEMYPMRREYLASPPPDMK